MDYETETGAGFSTASPLIRPDSQQEDTPTPTPTKDGVAVAVPGDKADDDDDKGSDEDVEKEPELLYGIDDRPPWYLLGLLGFQQFLLAVISQVLNPLMIAGPLCIANDVEGLGEFITGIFFVAGISSLLQTTFGIRLPIIQGPSAAFIAPIMMLMKRNEDKCPDFSNPGNVTLPFLPGSDEHKTLWKANLRELQGALMVAALVEMLIGFSGVIGFLMRYIGPLTTATVLMLIGLSVSTSASDKGSTQWWICIMSIFLIVLFSQYLRKVTVPFFGGVRIKIFLLFPVLLGIGIAWFICFILTVSGALPEEKGKWGYEARTDIKTDSLTNAAWFRVPYPGQWGMPTLSAGGVVAMIAAIMASTIESIGDYQACAKLCVLPPPPPSAISRGIGMEGFACFLGGAWGTGSGFTSYSGNVVSIGLTRVGSRVVIQLASAMLLVVGLFVKFGTFFGTVPTPIVGGMIYVMFGMVTAVGVSALSLVDLNAVRNLFVFGFSVFFGFSAPMWITNNPIQIGNETVDEVLNIFCGTSMLMGGTIAFVLDNTVPGTLKERGIFINKGHDHEDTQTGLAAYDIPFVKPLLEKARWLRCLPICPESYRHVPPSTADGGAYSPNSQPSSRYDSLPVEVLVLDGNGGKHTSPDFSNNNSRPTSLTRRFYGDNEFELAGMEQNGGGLISGGRNNIGGPAMMTFTPDALKSANQNKEKDDNIGGVAVAVAALTQDAKKENGMVPVVGGGDKDDGGGDDGADDDDKTGLVEGDDVARVVENEGGSEADLDR